MCLIAWNWQPDSNTPLLLVGNRDEFYARPAEALRWWNGNHVLAGKDLQAGGTWLGVTRSGRLAALTNYRDIAGAGNPSSANPSASYPQARNLQASNLQADGAAPSRGELVADFLKDTLDSRAFLQRLSHRAAQYNPFNLLVFDGKNLLGLQSRTTQIQTQIIEMQPGVGAVSNADFHSPWPKLVRLRDQLCAHVNRRSAGSSTVEAQDRETLLTMLRNDAIAPDDALPRTGLPLARERALSAAFITSPDYGTRASSVVHIGQTEASFTECRFGPDGALGTQNHRFALRAGLRVQNNDHDDSR